MAKSLQCDSNRKNSISDWEMVIQPGQDTLKKEAKGSLLADSGFFLHYYSIKVAWSLQFLGYLKTLSLQKKRKTSILVLASRKMIAGENNKYGNGITKIPSLLQVCTEVQVNLCQKLLFLHQLTHIMTTDCSLNYKFNTWKFQAQTWGEHVVYRNCFWHSE